MYDDQTQNYHSEIHDEYLVHDNPFPATSFIAMCRLSIAINTKRQQFSAVTVSLKSGFLRLFF